MCGIFGLNIAPESSLNSSEIKEVVSKLFRLSERRGKDASGLMLLTSEYIHVYKSPIKASKTIKTKKDQYFQQKEAYKQSGNLVIKIQPQL